VASLWLLTAVLVLHPAYRAEGLRWLDRLHLPGGLMWVTCGAELVLGLRVGLGRPTAALTALQVALVAGFSLVLAVLDPMLLVHPFGILTKNLPFLAVVGTVLLLEREGWSPRAAGLLRVGMAIIWITEGLLPKLLFQQPMELAVVANSGLVPFDPSLFLRILGIAQLLSGLLALRLRGRLLAALLGCQVAALVLLPLLVSVQDPLLWVHPFGPMTKNIPIIVGTVVLARRAWRP